MPATLDAPSAPTSPMPVPGCEPTRAAFFGLDQTLMPGLSMFLLAQGLHQRDHYDTGEILRFAWEQSVFRVRRFDSAQRKASSKQAGLEFVRGRHRLEVESLVEEIADERIVPQIYPSMALLIERYRAEGIQTLVTTAAPVELARFVAQRLGMTGALGTQAEVDGGDRYNGRLNGPVLHGPAKAAAVATYAAAAGIDLSASMAYSDSINDLPLLELVGRPEVVNPDRRLRKVAERSGWPVHEPATERRERRAVGPTPVAHRLAELGLQLSPIEGATGHRGRTHQGTIEDPDVFVRDLEASGRFRRDTRLGSLYHRGEISLREVSPSHSLHITARGNEISAHVDRFSPLAHHQPEHGCRYALHRIAAHNLTGMASDLARLIPRRRRHRARR
ncbi:MAG TPA: HAD-IB family hydrolase [Acidimicrobiales bacterium]|nr:HAD-IB family hydrolase [Acidimicrobiales bacterium]